MSFIVNGTTQTRQKIDDQLSYLKAQSPTLSHQKLRDVIRREEQRLDELKKIYMKEEEILSRKMLPKRNELLKNKRYDKEQNEIPTLLLASPIKLLSTEESRPVKHNQLHNRFQYDDDEHQLLIGLCTSRKKYSKQMQKLSEIEKRLRRIEAKVESNGKEDGLDIGIGEKKYELFGGKDDMNTFDVFEDEVKRKIVYEDKERGSMIGMQKSKRGINHKQVQAVQLNDKKSCKVIRKVSPKQTVQVNNKKSLEMIKTFRSKSTKSITFIRQNSMIKLKSRRQQKQLDNQLMNNYLSTYHSHHLNQKISSRLILQSCVFKDQKMRNDRNETNWLISRFQSERKARRDVKTMINADPKVLKKHQMVVD